MMQEIQSLEQLQSELTESDGAVVMFTQPRTCVPCRQFRPHFEKAAESSELNFLYVDLDKVPDAVVEYDLMGVPTVRLFKSGEPVADLKERTVIKFQQELTQY